MAVFNLSWRKVKTQVSNLEGNVNKILILILGKNLPVDEFCQIKKQSINTGFFLLQIFLITSSLTIKKKFKVAFPNLEGTWSLQKGWVQYAGL